MGESTEGVVVRGVAASTCFGVGVEALYRGLEGGLYPDGPPRGRGEPMRFRPVEHDASEVLAKSRTDDRLTIQLLAAIELDLGRMIGQLGSRDRTSTSVTLGNCRGNLPPYVEYLRIGKEEGYKAVNPVNFPATLLNYPTAQVSNAFELIGANTTIGSGVASGLEAISYAAARIEMGAESFGLAGGVEQRNEHDAAPSGSCPSEGVAILFLERLSTHGRREPLASILGYAASKGLEEEGPDGIRQRSSKTLEEAISAARLQPDDIDAVFPSMEAGGARGTEATVLSDVFGHRLRSLPLYAIKDVVGECWTAGGPLQCAAAVYGLQRAPAHDEAGVATNIEGKAVRFPRRISRCDCALVYTLGSDHTTAAIVLARP